MTIYKVFMCCLYVLCISLVLTARAFGATFGNTATSTAYNGNGTNARVHVAAAFTLAVTQEIGLDSVSLHCRSVYGNSMTVGLAIYRWRNGMATDSLASGTLTLTHSITAWKAIPITLTVSAGDTICIAEGNVDSTANIRISRTNVADAGSYRTASTLSNPWVSTGLSAYPVCVYAVYHTTGGATPSGRRRKLIMGEKDTTVVICRYEEEIEK